MQVLIWAKRASDWQAVHHGARKLPARSQSSLSSPSTRASEVVYAEQSIPKYSGPLFTLRKLRCNAIEKAVDKGDLFLAAAISFGQLQRLVDRHGCGNIGPVEYFEKSEAQQVAIDGAEALQLPANQILLNQRIQLCPVPVGPFDNLPGKENPLSLSFKPCKI